MTADQVHSTLEAFERVGISGWIDGGWGVDALLREQTRVHDDLDLVIAMSAVSTACEVLATQGYVIERDWMPTALAWRSVDGRAVDLHPVEPTADGGGDQILLDGSTRWRYAAPAVGAIAGRPVLCCSVECQIAAHLGYEPDGTDRADVRRLAQRFGLQPPEPY